jgi:hypothetical protein
MSMVLVRKLKRRGGGRGDGDGEYLLRTSFKLFQLDCEHSFTVKLITHVTSQVD